MTIFEFRLAMAKYHYLVPPYVGSYLSIQVPTKYTLVAALQKES